MPNEIKKVDSLTPDQEKVYNLTREQALERLKEAGVSESQQMLLKWCRDNEIDSVRIAKGHPKKRGLRVSEKSLEVFILSKGGNSKELLKKIENLEEQLAKAQEEIKNLKKINKELKEKGIQVPKKPRYKIDSFVLASVDNLEANFRYNRAGYSATFSENGDEVIEVRKRVRGNGDNFKDVTKDTSEGLKNAILEKYKDALKKEEEKS